MNKNQGQKPNILRRFINFLKSIFLHGLFTLIPITATIFIITFVYTFLSRWLDPLRVLEPEWVQMIPGSEIVIVTLLIFAIGALLKLFLLDSIVHYFERLLYKIPLVRTIYSSAKKLVDFFNVPTQDVMRQVVLIEYPRPGYYNIAFLLGPAEDNFGKIIKNAGKNQGEEYIRVFMPNSPYPSTGYFFVLPKSVAIYTDITFEEAIKTVVSCGLIVPDSLEHVEISQSPPPEDRGL